MRQRKCIWLSPITPCADLAIPLSEERSFTVNGAITPAKSPHHFFLPPAQLSELEQYVVKSSFFMLYGTRGAGKTTAALQLLQLISSKYHVRPLKLDLNSVTIGSTRVEFWRSIFKMLRDDAERQNIIMRSFEDVAGFVAAFTRNSLGGARVLLMLDEFDKLDHAADGIKEEVSIHCRRGLHVVPIHARRLSC